MLIALSGCVSQSMTVSIPQEAGNGDNNNNNDIGSMESESAPSSQAEIQRQPDIAEYTAYINDVLPRYIGSTVRFGEYSSDGISNMQISQGFTVIGNPDENSRTFFITDNGEYIGLLIVTYLNNTFHSSFGFEDNENITAAIRDNVPIALFVLDGGSVFIQTEDSTFQLTAFINPDDIRALYPAAFETSYEKTGIILSDLDFNSADIVSSASSG